MSGKVLLKKDLIFPTGGHASREEHTNQGHQ
jgi:hypothetical protein